MWRQRSCFVVAAERHRQYIKISDGVAPANERILFIIKNVHSRTIRRWKWSARSLVCLESPCGGDPILESIGMFCLQDVANSSMIEKRLPKSDKPSLLTAASTIWPHKCIVIIRYAKTERWRGAWLQSEGRIYAGQPGLIAQETLRLRSVAFLLLSVAIFASPSLWVGEYL